MKEKKLKVITIVGMSVAAMVGSIWGLFFTIFGYLTGSGPGGSMEGPLWKILLTGILTVLIGAYIGELVVRLFAKIMFVKQLNHLEYVLRSFAMVLVGSLAAFVTSWEIGYLLGKITGTIQGLDWIAVLVYTPLMSFIYGIPISIIAAILMGLFVFIYLKPRGLQPGRSGIMIITVLVLSQCDYMPRRMGEMITDKTAGMNGSFEVVKSGLPVNWIFYAPTTVPEGDFDIIVDTVAFKDGKQSLKFNVRECVATGGWYSPGFCMEFPAEPGQTFKISFWYMNDGSGVHAVIGGISASSGKYEKLLQTSETISDWQLAEYQLTIPEKATAIRFELNILKPGIFWIDDLKIDKI